MVKKQKDVYRMPGREQFAAFLKANRNVFNTSEIERLCEFAPATLRHVCAGSREIDQRQYEKLQAVLLPKLCELVLLLQLYR